MRFSPVLMIVAAALFAGVQGAVHGHRPALSPELLERINPGLEEAIGRGLDPELLLDLLDQAVIVGRNSPGYARMLQHGVPREDADLNVGMAYSQGALREFFIDRSVREWARDEMRHMDLHDMPGAINDLHDRLISIRLAMAANIDNLRDEYQDAV